MKNCKECSRVKAENIELSKRFEKAKELIEFGLKERERLARLVASWKVIASEGRGS